MLETQQGLLIVDATAKPLHASALKTWLWAIRIIATPTTLSQLKELKRDAP